MILLINNTMHPWFNIVNKNFYSKNISKRAFVLKEIKVPLILSTCGVGKVPNSLLKLRRS